MLAFIHAHLVPLGGAVLAALTVSAAAAVDTGAGIVAGVGSRTEVESQWREAPAVVPAGLSLATDVSEGVTAVAEAMAVDLAVPVETEGGARAAADFDGNVEATSASPLGVGTGLHGHVESEVKTSVGVDLAGGEPIVLLRSPESPVELVVEKANVDGGLSLSPTDVGVGVETATTVASGLSLR